MTNPSHQRFVERLRAQVPGFEAVYEKHLHEYDELLAHVLFGDLVRFLEDEIRLRGPTSLALRNAMELLEEGMGSPDEALQNLVTVSFIENLNPHDHETFPVFRNLFGPNLRAQMLEVVPR